MKNRINTIFICSTIIGILVSVTYKFNSFIMPVPVPVYAWSPLLLLAVLDCAFFISMRGKLAPKPYAGYAMMVINLLFALSVFVGNCAIPSIFILLVMPFLISIQTLLFTNGNEIGLYNKKSVSEIFYDVFVRNFEGAFRFFSKNNPELNEKLSVNKRAVKIAVLAVIAVIPFAVIAIALLSSADEIFGNFISNLGLSNLGEIIGMVFLMVIASYIALSHIYSHYSFKKTNNYAYANTPKTPGKKIPQLFTIIFILVIDLIYTVFSVIQFMYLFSGKIPEGVTLSEYTVSGFRQLIFLTLLNMILLAVSIMFTDKSRHKNNIVLKVINMFLVINNIVMTASAYVRLSEYEKAYGFTHIRFYGYLLLIITAILLIFSAIKIMADKFPLRRISAWTILLFVLCIMFIDTNSFIAQKNINRYIDSSKTVDTDYLSTLGPGAIPQLQRLKDSTDDKSLKYNADKAIEKIKDRYNNEDNNYKTIKTMIYEDYLSRE